MVAGLPNKQGHVRYRFAEPEPYSLRALTTAEDDVVAALAQKISLRITLGYVADSMNVDELPAPHQASIARGRVLYGTTCAACHQVDGLGLPGLAPPFAESEWLEKPISELAKITVNGLSGPIKVNGVDWDMIMPGWPHLSDQEIADVLNYVLSQWAKKNRLVKPDQVAAQR